MSMLYDTIKVIDDDYLIGLSNKGTVKRAYKDLEGMVVDPVMSEDKISFDFEGLKCELVMPLSDSSCSCPQIGICRHIVTLVLAAKKKLESGMADAEGSVFSSDEEPGISGNAGLNDSAGLNGNTGVNGNAGPDENIGPNNSTG